MGGVGRNLWLTATSFALLALAAVVLRSALWLCALAALLGLAGVILLRGNRWRSGALLIAAVAYTYVDTRATSALLLAPASSATSPPLPARSRWR